LLLYPEFVLSGDLIMEPIILIDRDGTKIAESSITRPVPILATRQVPNSAPFNPPKPGDDGSSPESLFYRTGECVIFGHKARLATIYREIKLPKGEAMVKFAMGVKEVRQEEEIRRVSAIVAKKHRWLGRVEGFAASTLLVVVMRLIIG